MSQVLEAGAAKPLDLDGDAALAELSRRYFRSRGPATIQDFTWWGGLTLTLARRGLAIVGKELENMAVNGQEYWWAGEPARQGAAEEGGAAAGSKKGAGIERGGADGFEAPGVAPAGRGCAVDPGTRVDPKMRGRPYSRNSVINGSFILL